MTSGSEATVVSFRLPGDASETCTRLWIDVPPAALGAAAPWRTFRWYRGQKHYSGTYWSSTMKGHVPYESRLELARLLFADFDRSVRVIAAQPFLLEKEVLGVRRRHVPDFLLLTESGPAVVDVKPRALLGRSEVARALAWTRDEVESRGWRYDVWSEPPHAELECVRFLAVDDA